MLRPLRHAAVPLIVLALAACGSSSDSGGTGSQAQNQAADSSYPGQSAQQLFDAATSATGAQKAVTIHGKTASQSGSASYTVTVMDTGTSGSLKAGASAVQFRRIGELSYIQASKSFYAAQGAAAAAIGAKIGNRWLVADPTTLQGISGMGGDQSSDIAGRYQTVASVLSSSVPAGATLTRVAGKKIGGVDTTGIAFTAPMPADQAAKLAASGGTAPTSVSGTVYLATNGTPLPAAIRSSIGGDLTLDSWGRTVKVVAPPKSQQVALNELLSGLGFGG